MFEVFDLERYFKTEAEKYKAYKMLLLATILAGVIEGILVATKTSYNSLPGLLWGLPICLTVLYVYVNIYLFVKCGALKLILKILLNGYISFCIIGALVLFVPSLGGLLFLISLWSLRDKRKTLKEKYGKYINKIIYPAVIAVIICTLSHMAGILSLFLSAIHPILTLAVGVPAVIIGNLILLWPTYVYVKLMDEECKNDVPFMTMVCKSIMVTVAYILFLFSIIALLGHSFFSADGIIDGLDDINIDHSGSIPDSVINVSNDNLNNNLIINTNDISSPISNDLNGIDNSKDVASGVAAANTIPTASFVFGNDYINTFNFNGVEIHTPMFIDGMQNNPHMLFAMDMANDAGQNFNIYDANGMLCAHVDNNIVYNSENVPYAKIFTAENGSLKMTDMNNVELAHQDPMGFLYSDNQVYGQITKSGNITTFRDVQENILWYKNGDNIFDQNGNPIGIKKY